MPGTGIAGTKSDADRASDLAHVSTRGIAYVITRHGEGRGAGRYSSESKALKLRPLAKNGPERA
eukprot:1134340-Rhodomonas_salina.3